MELKTVLSQYNASGSWTIFNILMLSEHGLDSVYDMTVAYRPETRIPSTELAVALGSIPAEVHLHTKRYRAIDLPTDEQGMRANIGLQFTGQAL